MRLWLGEVFRRFLLFEAAWTSMTVEKLNKLAPTKRKKLPIVPIRNNQHLMAA